LSLLLHWISNFAFAQLSAMYLHLFLNYTIDSNILIIIVTDEWESLHTDRTKFSLRTKTDDTIDVDREGSERKSIIIEVLYLQYGYLMNARYQDCFFMTQ